MQSMLVSFTRPRTSRRAFLTLCTIAPMLLAAQAPRDPLDRAFATRAELQAQLTEATQLSGADSIGAARREVNAARATSLRARLTEGDFRSGDRIAFVLRGTPGLSDTLTVRGNRTVTIRDLAEVSLAGILRSELQAHLAKEIGRYRREPDITAIPLLRIAVLGRVARPGYYALPLDAPVTDALMLAGGPSPDADVTKTIMRREGREIRDAGAVRQAFADGQTLDQLDLRAGDEIVVGQRTSRNWQGILQGAALLVGIAVSLIATR